MKLYWITVGLNTMTGAIIKREKFGHRYIQREGDHEKTKAEIRIRFPQTK